MREKSVAIVGGGLAGLSAGCYLRRSGYRTHIFEQHTLPGGVCTAWNRKGYTFDGCIHWLMGCKPGSFPHRIFEEVGALEGDPLRPLTHYARLVDEATGQALDIGADLGQLERDLLAIGPEDAPAIRVLIGGARALAKAAVYPEKPQELMGLRDGLSLAWRMRHALPLLARYNQSVADFTKRFRNPFLRWALSHTFTPEMPTLFLFMILGQLSAGELAGVAGGSLRFAQSVAKRYQALGGEITYGAGVEQILVEEDRAVGVRLADGTVKRADTIISAADAHSTLFKMLPERYVDTKWRERFEQWPLFRPIVIASFGAAREFPEVPTGHIVGLREPLTVGATRVESAWVRVWNDDPSLAPAGKTVVQAILTTDFDSWWALKEDRPRYEAEKERVAAEVLRRLDAHLPGLSQAVETTDVATPYTMVRYTRNYRAAFEGWAMTPRMFTTRVPKTLPGLAGFYMAGQWVEPGGGVGTVLLSGRNAAWLICHADGKPFATG